MKTRLFRLVSGAPAGVFLAGSLAALFSLAVPTFRNQALLAASQAASQLSRAKESRPKAVPVPPVAKDLAVPYRAGETLNYRITWAAFTTAASLEVTVPERRNLFGWPTWHFRAALHTQAPVRTLFTVDDEFDSYADAATLETRQYESYLDELGRKNTQVLHFVSVGEASRVPGPYVRVLPGTRDPVGVLFSLRGVDWQKTPEFNAPLYDGRDTYQVTARLEAKGDAVTVAAGSFSASRVAVRLSRKDQKVQDINFEVWLANNAQKTPVQFQAALPFGSVRAELAPPSK